MYTVVAQKQYSCCKNHLMRSKLSGGKEFADATNFFTIIEFRSPLYGQPLRTLILLAANNFIELRKIISI